MRFNTFPSLYAVSFQTHPETRHHSETRPKTRRHEAGFSLLELLLVIGVLGIVTIGITRMTQSWVDSETANNAGQHMAHITSVVQRFVDARGLDLTTTDDVLVACDLGEMQWEDLCVALEQEGLLVNNRIRSPAGIDLTIAYLNEIDPLNPSERVYRATVIGTSTLPNRRVLQIARQVGATGGTVMTTPSNPDIATIEAIGAFGQWVLDVADLTASFPCAYEVDKGCVISVVNYTQDELCGVYLYRHPTACPDGNTMYTSLNMNGQEIQNAANITTENLFVEQNANLGNTNVTGTADFHGPTTASGGLTANAGMTVTGDATFADNVTLNGGTLNVTQLNAHDIRTPSINTNRLDAQDLQVIGNVTVHDNVTVSGSVNAPAVYSTTVNASTVNATGEINTGAMTVQNTMTVTGALTIHDPAGTIITDHLVAEGCVNISGETYGPGC